MDAIADLAGPAGRVVLAAVLAVGPVALLPHMMLRLCGDPWRWGERRRCPVWAAHGAVVLWAFAAGGMATLAGRTVLAPVPPFGVALVDWLAWLLVGVSLVLGVVALFFTARWGTWLACLAILSAGLVAGPRLLSGLCEALFSSWCWRPEALLTFETLLAWLGFAGVAIRPLFAVPGQRRRIAALLGREASEAGPGRRDAPGRAPRGQPERGPGPEAGPGPAAGPGRRIVICCDGTSNRPDMTEDGRPSPTNVWKIARALCHDESQVVWYDAGVGSDTSTEAAKAGRLGWIAEALGLGAGVKASRLGRRLRMLLEAGTGVGITENIVQGYREIVRQYRPGDRIYLIGFSRGAWTARCIAGVIHRCGLLRTENLRYAEDVVRLYLRRGHPEEMVAIAPELVHRDVEIEFLGCFDTVASIGVPLWGWWFNFRPLWRNLGAASDTPTRGGRPPAAIRTGASSICRTICHAMAMDERRAQFFPSPFLPSPPGRRLEQVWFRGNHGDIGGGYADTGLSDIALGWMIERAMREGLRFAPDALAALRPDPLGRIHDQLARQPAWNLFGSWPRWHPAPLEPDDRWGRLHPSVLTRAAALEGSLGRHDLRLVGTEAITFGVEARREWDRTGLILEGEGATYRLRWLGGRWRDQDGPPCGPSGVERPGLFQRLASHAKRLPEERYMCLVATIAHPRDWPLRELGLRRLFRYLFHADPAELTEQLAPIGRDLHHPRTDEVYLRNGGRAGMLYLFANDLWTTAANNSGGLELEIKRVEADDVPGSAPVWTLAADHPPARWPWRRQARA